MHGRQSIREGESHQYALVIECQTQVEDEIQSQPSSRRIQCLDPEMRGARSKLGMRTIRDRMSNGGGRGVDTTFAVLMLGEYE